MTNACLPLQPSGCRGVIASLHGGDDVTIGEFAELEEHCEHLLPLAKDRLITVSLHPDWPARKRRLSLGMR